MAKKAAKGGKKTSREVLVVGTKVKDVVKTAGLQSSGELRTGLCVPIKAAECVRMQVRQACRVRENRALLGQHR